MIKRSLFGAALALAFTQGAFAAQEMPPHPLPPRLISVSGDADVSAVPDRARIQIGVTQVSPEVATAEAAVNKVVKAYVAEAKKLGARDEDIATAGISIQPEYVWDEKARNNKLTGYRVSRDIETRVGNLDKLGDYLLAATRAGVNQVQPPVLESSKADDLQNQALVQAAKNAQAKARLLADTLGVKLGSVHGITEEGSAPAPQPMMKAMAMRGAEASDSGNADMGLQTGEIRFHAAVNAQFEVAP
ncbi:SIMPL domain-containing protein [Hydrocarboniphaga sp.]|uniref:SIMPL domain-containing protein n=1 Tax=Hydrocarboniphaga sp. TaxID=2033016 RepID=UPI003D0A4F70